MDMEHRSSLLVAYSGVSPNNRADIAFETRPLFFCASYLLLDTLRPRRPVKEATVWEPRCSFARHPSRVFDVRKELACTSRDLFTSFRNVLLFNLIG
jgi:hypothetical protein